MKDPLRNGRLNRDRRDDAFARSVIAEAEKRRRDGLITCETCGERKPAFSYSHRYAFCSAACHTEYLQSLEGA